MRVTFLGTAAAEGVPQLWCRCDNCRIARERGGRHVRCRTATLINDDLLIDAGPDLASAAGHLGLDLSAVRTLLITHPHYDHLDAGSLRDRGRYWGGTALPQLSIYGSRASLGLLAQRSDAASLHYDTHPIAPFGHFVVTTGGMVSPDPRLPSMAPFPAMPVRRYDVWTLAAAHAQANDEAMLFAIRQSAGPDVASRGASAALLYATDTGPFPAATWAALDTIAAEGLRFGVTIVDATFGVGRDLKDPSAHMTIAQMIEMQRELARRGLLTEDVQRLAIHFSHYFTPPHDELVTLLAPEGIEAAYDGLTLTL